MGKRRKKQSGRAADLLSKRPTTSELEELIRRIRQINPTGRGLSPSAREQRYREKSALQSELVRRFGEELEVIGESDATIVSLRTKSLGRDACHAVVEELEEDAKAWIRRKLDEGAHDESDEPYPVLEESGAAVNDVTEWQAATVDELLAVGRRAVTEFDLDLAHRLLRRAFDDSMGKLAPSLALLELLVDQLGLDDEALAVEPRIASAARANGEVCVLLAVSAARTGHRKRALRWIKNLEHPRVGEVLAQLALTEARGGSEHEARQLAVQLERIDPAHPVVREVATEIAKRRADARAPAEQRVRSLAASGDFEAAARAARELLDSDPDSATARRILTEAEAQLVEQSARRLMASARDASAQGELREAVALLRQTRALQVGDHTAREAAEALTELEARLAKRAADAAVKRVCEALQVGNGAAGLHAYLALSDVERESVRQRAPDPALSWLEHMNVGTRHIASAVEAVMCLREIASLRESDPEAFLQAVSGHHLLRQVPDCRSWIARAHAMLRDRTELSALDAMALARTHVDAGDPEEARRIVEQVPDGNVPLEAREKLDSLRVEIDERLRALRWEKEYAEHIRQERWLEARDVAREASEVSDEPWRDRARAMQTQVQKAWRVHVDASVYDGPQPEFDAFRFRDGAVPVLTSDGECVVLHAARSHWSFISVVRLSDGASVERVMFRTPLSMDLANVVVKGEEIWLCGSEAVLELSRSEWQVKRWVDVRRRIPSGHPGGIELTPDLAHVWVETTVDQQPIHDVVNLETGAVNRLQDDFLPPNAVWGSRTPSILVSKLFGPTLFADCRGKPLMSSLTAMETCIAAVVSPSGDGFVAAGGSDMEDDDDNDLGLLLVARSDAVAAPVTHALAGFDHESALASMGVSSRDGLVYLLAKNVEDQYVLLGLRVNDGAIEEAFRTPISKGWTVMMSIDTMRSALVTTSLGVVRSVALGASKPEVPTIRSRDHALVPSSRTFWSCPTENHRDDDAYELSLELRHSPSQRMATEAFENEHVDDPEALLKLWRAMNLLERFKDTGPLMDRIIERHPNHSVVRCIMADRAAKEDEHERMIELLEPIEADALPGGYRCHRYHLLGVAHACLGHFEKARDAMERVQEHDQPRCDVDGWLQMVHEVKLPLPRDWWEQDRPELEKLVGALEQADAHINRGETREAWRVLDHATVWNSTERQTVARLAEAAMACSDAGQLPPFRAAHAVAAFVAIQEEPATRFAHEIRRPKGTWGSEKLEELAMRARRWLEDERWERLGWS